MSQPDKAAAFARMHAGPDLLVLPNCWDAASAALMEDAGSQAVATSSAAVAWAHGYPDGDKLPVSLLLQTLREIGRVLTVPLTADIEGGYTDDLDQLARTVRGVVEAGCVGINLEDGDREPDLHVRKVAAAVKVGQEAGVALFVNARVDVYLRGGEGEAGLAETLRRARLYTDAGAAGIFVPGPVDETLIGALAAGIDLPMNVMGRPGAPTAARLQQLGVRRLSSAASPFRLAYAAMEAGVKAYLTTGDSSALALEGASLPNLNSRFN